MLRVYFNLKFPRLARLRLASETSFRRFPPVSGRWRRITSYRFQSGQPFQVPTDIFRLQLQSVGLSHHISNPALARAPLPPAEHLFNLAPDRTEQPVGLLRTGQQFFPGQRSAQDAVDYALPGTPFPPIPAPIRLVRHDNILVATDSRLKFPALMHVGTSRGAHWVSIFGGGTDFPGHFLEHGGADELILR